jgi:beta-lactamase regulating signal transducer with metallopeptidase domain
MSHLFVDAGWAAMIWMIVKASVLLGAAAVVQAFLRRRGSAAARHLVWTLAIVSVLLLPLVSAALPAWTLAVPASSMAIAPAAIAPDADALANAEARPPAAVASDPLVRTAAAPASIAPQFAPSWPATLIALYLIVAAALLARVLVERWRVRRFARRTTLVAEEEWQRLFAECARRIGVARAVRLLRSREHGVPAAIGTLRPAIVIPAIADTWTEDRRRAVLLHELAHVARFDCLTQTLASVACAVYWFHPAAWWTARRLRIERELACDDRAIAAGAEARDYAGHLLEIAYSFGRHRAPALAVSMARRSQIEGRLLAALDDARNRSMPARSLRIAGAVAASALLLAIAAARPTAVAAERTGAAPASPVPAVAAQSNVDVRKSALDVVRRVVRATSEAAGIAQNGLPGTWEIRPTNTDGTVHLRLVELNSSSGSNIKISDLDGLNASQLAGAGGPVQFRLRRDAGTFTFEGVARAGVAAGTFSFAPDANFAGELAKRGFARPTAAEQYQLARHDVGFAFVDELNKQGYAKPATPDLVRAAQHGVGLTYLREMGALGHRLGSLDPLITLRDHGVTPDYIRGLQAEGYKELSADALRNARDHGITPEYVRGMRDAGYASLPMDALVRTRDHGVTPDYARQLAEFGYAKLPLEELIRVRDHGISTDYVRDMRALGHTLPLDGLVRARDHGVGVEYVRELNALGYSKLPIDTLIRMRDHGVGADYVRELQGLGYKDVPVDDLVGMRDHGLSVERIRAANSKAGTRLPLDMLKSLAGMR